MFVQHPINAYNILDKRLLVHIIDYILLFFGANMSALESSVIFEWAGCIFGVAGALLLALNNRYSGYGFVAFLASNAAWILYGILNGAYGMVTMQAVFTFTSLLGIWRWVLRPRFAVLDGSARS